VRLRERPAVPPPGDVLVAGSERRPVVLATLAVPFEPEAFRVALQAVTSGLTAHIAAEFAQREPVVRS